MYDLKHVSTIQGVTIQYLTQYIHWRKQNGLPKKPDGRGFKFRKQPLQKQGYGCIHLALLKVKPDITGASCSGLLQIYFDTFKRDKNITKGRFLGLYELEE
ncbi:unnamed protein product [Prunus brigantina]